MRLQGIGEKVTDRLEIVSKRLSPYLDKVQGVSSKWDSKHWIGVAILLQVLAAPFVQVFLFMNWFDNKGEDPNISLVSELSIVEYQDPTETPPDESQELSDEIQETDSLTEDKPINWANAVDPSLDINQRYVARLLVNISPDDYPTRAANANIGKVVVAVTLYITAQGRVKDVAIRNIRSQGDAAQPFSDDFTRAVRNILLTKTQLAGPVYKVAGEAKDFKWDTTVTFTVQ